MFCPCLFVYISWSKLTDVFSHFPTIAFEMFPICYHQTYPGKKFTDGSAPAHFIFGGMVGSRKVRMTCTAWMWKNRSLGTSVVIEGHWKFVTSTGRSSWLLILWRLLPLMYQCEFLILLSLNHGPIKFNESIIMFQQIQAVTFLIPLKVIYPTFHVCLFCG